MALDLLSDQGFRMDGRRADELRRLQCRLGVFSQADGSAYVEQGNTKVLAAVYGPHEVANAKLKIHSFIFMLSWQYSRLWLNRHPQTVFVRINRGAELRVHFNIVSQSSVPREIT